MAKKVPPDPPHRENSQGHAWKDQVSFLMPYYVMEGYGEPIRWQVPEPPGWWKRKHAETVKGHSAAVVQQKVDGYVRQSRLPLGSPPSNRVRRQAARSRRGGTGGSGNARES